MSSILKALKKLEEEKTAKQGQRVDITRDIFGAGQQPVTGNRWPLIAAGTAGVVALGVVAYLFISRPGPRQAPPLPAPAETRLNAAVPSPPPAAVSDTMLPQPVREATPETAKPAVAPATVGRDTVRSEDLPSAPLRPARVTVPPKPPAPSSPPVISANRPVISNLPSPPQQAKPAVTGATAPPAASATPAAPRITVSGIAYNKEAADRLAVINGVPTGEGKSVNGVTVEEIMPDKVRFSFGQKNFEVPVGRSNQ